MKKGQAAIEYVMTYGWAILALVIIIGVIFYSGIFSPTSFISEECTFGNSFPCNFAVFNDASQTNMILQIYDGFAYKIRLYNLSMVTDDGLNVVFPSSIYTGSDNGVNISSGGSINITGYVRTHQLPAGSIKRFTGNFTYVSCSPDINQTACGNSLHIISGSITAKIGSTR